MGAPSEIRTSTLKTRLVHDYPSCRCLKHFDTACSSFELWLALLLETLRPTIWNRPCYREVMLREDLRLGLPERPCCREVMLREDLRLSLSERPCCREVMLREGLPLSLLGHMVQTCSRAWVRVNTQSIPGPIPSVPTGYFSNTRPSHTETLVLAKVFV